MDATAAAVDLAKFVLQLAVADSSRRCAKLLELIASLGWKPARVRMQHPSAANAMLTGA
jgi:hypothetical protein